MLCDLLESLRTCRAEIGSRPLDRRTIFCPQTAPHHHIRRPSPAAASFWACPPPPRLRACAAQSHPYKCKVQRRMGEHKRDRWLACGTLPATSAACLCCPIASLWRGAHLGVEGGAAREQGRSSLSAAASAAARHGAVWHRLVHKLRSTQRTGWNPAAAPPAPPFRPWTCQSPARSCSSMETAQQAHEFVGRCTAPGVCTNCTGASHLVKEGCPGGIHGPSNPPT